MYVVADLFLKGKSGHVAEQCVAGDGDAVRLDTSSEQLEQPLDQTQRADAGHYGALCEDPGGITALEQGAPGRVAQVQRVQPPIAGRRESVHYVQADLVGHRPQECRLVGQVVVEAANVYAEPRGYGTHGQAVKPDLGHRLQCRVRDRGSVHEAKIPGRLLNNVQTSASVREAGV